MLDELLTQIAKHPHVGDLRRCGLIAGIELVADRDSKAPYPWIEKRGERVCDYARTEGVLLRPLGQCDPHFSAANGHLASACIDCRGD